MTRRRLLSSAVALTACCFVAGNAWADELTIGGESGVARSQWSGDGALISGGRIGYRLTSGLEFEAFARAGYADGGEPDFVIQQAIVGSRLERRTLGMVGAAARFSLPFGRVRPFARIGVLRQDERDIERFADDVLGSAFGTGDDIRRRVGLLGGAGTELGLVRFPGASLSLTVEVSATALADREGPRWYAAATGGLSLAFDWGRLRSRW